MNKIELIKLELKTFTEQNVSDYCFLNNLNINKITELDLSFNKLTDISGIRLFKNLEKLFINNNKLTDIPALKYLTDLKVLDLGNNNISDIFFLKDLKSLKELNLNNNNISDISVLKNIINYLTNIRLDFNNITDISVLRYLTDLRILYLGNNNIKDISVLKKLLELEILNITNLELESDQINCIKNMENLKILFCKNGFKDITVLNQLNKNIETVF